MSRKIFNLKTALLVIVVFFSCRVTAQDMPPPAVRPMVQAIRTTGPIKLDGILNEPDWQKTPVIKGFKQVEPLQGQPARFDTEIRLIFDDKNLYVGVYAKDTIGKKGLRTNDLTRDFDIDNNDVVSVAIDAYDTKRNAIAFQVTPLGNQRDLQTFDDNIFDIDWDALWETRTTITDSGWFAEIVLPFNTFSYPAYKNGDTVNWGINFLRIHRRSNEISAFPGHPRSLDTYRMTYAAALRGLHPPKHELNLRVDPYVVFQNLRSNTTATGKNTLTAKTGGDIRWGNTPHSTVDLTINTDFAQADVDQQVINLTRFSIFLPERRQFFLENAGLFSTGDDNNLQPYFSRSIGLDQDGKPIPIITGAKYTDRTSSHTIGALYTLQNSDSETPVTQFGVFRYVKNYGNQNNIGILLTEKEKSSANNTVVGFTGVNRIGNYFRVNYLYSNSFDRQSTDAKTRAGTGANVTVDYTNNDISITSNQTLISEQYIPGIGFISRNNLLTNTSDVIFFSRPKWKPRFIRAYQPGIFLNVLQQASDLGPLEGSVGFYPLYLAFNDGSSLSFAYKYIWENLTDNFDLLNLDIAKGNYRFKRVYLRYSSDHSKKIAFDFSGEDGAYYNGRLLSLTQTLTLAPIPNINLIAGYQYNFLDKIGITKGSVNTNLLTVTLRLALNPNIQLSSFYQYNSTLRNARFNERFSWQFKPLSYIYLVFNSSKDDLAKTLEQQSIYKISYLKQF